MLVKFIGMSWWNLLGYNKYEVFSNFFPELGTESRILCEDMSKID